MSETNDMRNPGGAPSGGSGTGPGTGKVYWLDDPRNVRKVLWSLYIACAGLFLADFFYVKHVGFAFEGWFGFFGIYGFVACVLLVLVAREIRKVVSRAEDYYGDLPSSEDTGNDR